MNYQSLLFCPDEKTARIVTQVLTELEFSVELCNEPFATVKKLMAKQYDAIVVDCDNEQNAALLFKSARNSTSNQASLAVAVVEGQVGVAKAFRIGANLVLTKPVNVEQSKGTLRVARGLLRKADTGKAPAGTPSAPPSIGVSGPVTANLNSPAVAHGTTSPAAFRASTSSIPAIPVAAASSASFEVDEDPTPQLEATESAFLESIPEPGVSKTPSHHGDTSQTHKESPWLQLSRPPRDGRAPLSENNSEAIAKANAGSTHNTSAIATPGRVRHPFNTGLSSAQGAAAAPTKEITSRPADKNPKSASESAAMSLNQSSHEADPMAVSSLESSEGASHDLPALATATDETKRSKAPLIAALVVIAIAWAGYFGRNKVQMAVKTLIARGSVALSPVALSSVQNKPVVPLPQPSAVAPTESAQPGPQTAGLQPQLSEPQQLPQLNQNQPAESHPTLLPPGEKPVPDEIIVVEHTATDPAVEAKPLTVKKVREPLAIKNDSGEIEPSVAPPALHAGSNSSDQAIAGLITTTSLPVPKRAPEVMRVSQGITEGMLVKKVSPIYPAQAMQLHKVGTVQILANIGKNGSIANAKLIKGDSMLGQAALTAVKQWKYKPYTLDGQAVEVQTQISVNFKLP
jgi:protein TonB